MTVRRCPITYEPLAETEERYSSTGLNMLSRRLTDLEPLPFSSAELIQEAAKRAEKMSIGGVQPKVSAVLRPAKSRFELVDTAGRYILKPETPQYPEVPANEDVTMRMASSAGVETPLHGLLYTRKDELCYFIRRFDRTGKGDKVAMEDFAQLLGYDRETKYKGSMEQVAKVVEDFCAFPVPQKVALFRWVLVVFLTGNEDHHLRNFSLITKDGITQLTPAYDMLCSTIALGNATEELALPLNGKKSNFKHDDLVDYYASQRLGLPSATIERVLGEVVSAQPTWDDLLARSFLSDAMKERFADVLAQRRGVLGL